MATDRVRRTRLPEATPPPARLPKEIMKYLTCSQIARLFPGARGAASVNPSTVTRLIQAGARLPDGTRLKLPATRLGSRWMVGEDDFRDFLNAVTRASLPAPTEHRTTGAASGRRAGDHRAAEAADRELTRLGL